jgi:hypothetical protein
MQMANTFTVGFYQALIPAKYQIVQFDNVPFKRSFDLLLPIGPITGTERYPYNEPPSGAFTASLTSRGNYNILLAASPDGGVQNSPTPRMR